MSRFCSQCGTQAEEEAFFCLECGESLSEQNKQQDPSKVPNMPSLSQMSKKTKLIIASVLILFISFFGLYKLGESTTDKDQLLTKFTEAVEKEDVKALQNLLFSGKEGIDLDAKNIEVMLQYWKENDYVKSNMFLYLNEQAIDYSQQVNGTSMEVLTVLDEEEIDDQAIVQLKKDGKKFLLFDHYKLMVNPIELLIETNYPNATYSVNGEQVNVEEKSRDVISLGTYLPGEYEVYSVLKNDFIDVSEKAEILLNDGNDYNSIYFDVEDVYIETSFDDASVFINGKDSERKIRSEGDHFGPVLTDGSMNIHLEVETPFGKLKSLEYKIDSSDIQPIFPLEDELKEQLIEAVNNIYLSYFKALMTKDINHLTGVTGNEKEDMESSVENMNETYQYLVSYLNQITYDLDEFELYYEDGKWNAKLGMALDYEYIGFYKDLESYEFEEVQSYLVYLVFERSQWEVSDSLISSSFNSVNEKVVSFDQGEQEKHKPEIKAVLNAEKLIDEYLHNLVYAINNDAFKEVEPYLLPDSELYKSQKALVDRYYEKGLGQDVIDINVLKVEEVGADESKIRVSETIGIYSDGEYREETFQWWYYAKMKGTKYFLYKLEKAS